jgi:hypothetical protein
VIHLRVVTKDNARMVAVSNDRFLTLNGVIGNAFRKLAPAGATLVERLHAVLVRAVGWPTTTFAYGSLQP